MKRDQIRTREVGSEPILMVQARDDTCLENEASLFPIFSTLLYISDNIVADATARKEWR